MLATPPQMVFEAHARLEMNLTSDPDADVGALPTNAGGETRYLLITVRGDAPAFCFIRLGYSVAVSAATGGLMLRGETPLLLDGSGFTHIAVHIPIGSENMLIDVHALENHR